MNSPAIHWFRNDLRLADNPALQAAARYPLICIYVLDEDSAGPYGPGGASRWWLHHSLEKLSASLSRSGGQLLLARGDTTKILESTARRYGVHSIYCNRIHEPWALEVERKVVSTLGDACELHVDESQLLSDPERVLSVAGQPFKVFTPYYKQLRREHAPVEPCGAPPRMNFHRTDSIELLTAWSLLPDNPDWAHRFPDHWSPGEAGAEDALQRFLGQPVTHYDKHRDLPATPGTSRLSAHLHFGEISPARIWHATNNVIAARASDTAGGESFLRELAWRDFSYYLLHYHPDMPEQPLRENFAAFPWQEDAELQKAWQEGQTGYPLVDAGMRELWHTGWMHNRVRMVVASFLIKHLLQPWQSGFRWFHDTLVDADLANNAASWQWVAGCGADASPWFRIFNPILQSQKFDPDGCYIRRWVPELEDVPADAIHQPWQISENLSGYPARVVSHSAARRRALDAYETIRIPA